MLEHPLMDGAVDANALVMQENDDDRPVSHGSYLYRGSKW